MADSDGGYVFRLPDLGEGAVEAEIVAWRVELGAEVREDDLLVEVMTDKATMEITSPVSGRLVSRKGKVGESLPVGSVLAVFETDAATSGAAEVRDAAEVPGTDAVDRAAVAPAVPAEEDDEPFYERDYRSSAATPEPHGAKPIAAPAVRKRAEDLRLDLATIAGTGPEGRITHADLDTRLTASAPVARSTSSAARPDEQVKVVGLRRKIAEKMAESKRRIPHYAYVEELDVTELEALRAHLNARFAKDRSKLTLLPFLITALAKALADYPQINATYDDEAGVLTRHGAVHVGLATQTPNGLMVPVIRDAQARDLWALAAEIVRLSSAARDGSAKRYELSGSTITVTSLGPLGGIAHTPVVNHPEVAIVGPNRIVERPVIRDGQIVPRKLMNLSASFDHRIVDGYDAASFIQAVKGLLEYPSMLFIA